MNDKQAALVGGPGILTIPAVDKDGNPITHTFLVSKPSAADLITYQKWVMAQKLPQAGGLSSKDLEGLSPEHQAVVLKEFAKAAKSRRTPSEVEIVEITYSPDGIAMQVWLASKAFHAGIRYEDVRKLVTEANCNQISADLDAATNPKKDDSETGEIDPKKPLGETSLGSSVAAPCPSPS